MDENRIEISQTLDVHHISFECTRRKALKVAKAYENYILASLEQLDRGLKTKTIFNGMIEIFDSEVSINVSPRYYNTTNIFNITIERCGMLDANLTYSPRIDHSDMNYLKLKDYNFYEQYLSNDYLGLIKYISARLSECLKPVPIIYDYTEDMRLRGK